MSATEEAAGTRPTPSLTRCSACERPLELEAQVSRKCTYCKHRIGWGELPWRDRMSTWFLEFVPYLLWVGLGVIVVIASGGRYG